MVIYFATATTNVWMKSGNLTRMSYCIQYRNSPETNLRNVCRLTQTGVVGEHALQSQTVLPLVTTAFTVAPQWYICRAVTYVVRCHDGTYKSQRSNVISESCLLTSQGSIMFNIMQDNMWTEIHNVMAEKTGSLSCLLYFTFLGAVQLNCFMAWKRKTVLLFYFILSWHTVCWKTWRLWVFFGELRDTFMSSGMLQLLRAMLAIFQSPIQILKIKSRVMVMLQNIISSAT